MSRDLDGVHSLLQADLEAHAHRLFKWWAAIETPAGFHPQIDTTGQPQPEIPQSIILTTRLLWYFSAYGRIFECGEARRLADKALGVLQERFFDPAFGGFVWSVSADDQVTGTHKQAYAQAFGIYALAEHYAATGDSSSLRMARDLFALLENHFRDPQFGGYIEALSRDLRPVEDQRLSDKDLNAPKSMNTHLHVLEAYTRLHQVAPDPSTARALAGILDVFGTKIIDASTGHLRLFFGLDWQSLSSQISFGHDIEASWLLYEAAEALKDTGWLKRMHDVALRLTELTEVEGMGDDGGVYYEADAALRHIDPVGEWWGQAEALVGFLNAYELSKNEAHLLKAWSVWSFVKQRHVGEGQGEWSWYPEGSGRTNPYLAGEWKCPYHNGRALMEGVVRLQRLTAGRIERVSAI
jgi:mannobiose 2-epimerase